MVEDDALKFIKTFKEQVIAQVDKRFSNGEAMAMSVINRGIGLTTEVTVPPELETVEKVIFQVFEATKTKYPQSQVLDPRLVEALMRFKAPLVETLSSKLGHLRPSRCSSRPSTASWALPSTAFCTQPNDDERAEFQEGREHADGEHPPDDRTVPALYSGRKMNV